MLPPLPPQFRAAIGLILLGALSALLLVPSGGEALVVGCGNKVTCTSHAWAGLQCTWDSRTQTCCSWTCPSTPVTDCKKKNDISYTISDVTYGCPANNPCNQFQTKNCLCQDNTPCNVCIA
jgi:hypothetical protein